MDEQLTTQLQVYRCAPDGPDFRDYFWRSDQAFGLRQFVEHCDSQQASSDLRDLMPSAIEPFNGVGAAAHAMCSLLEYFHQNCDGSTARISRSFVHHTSLLLGQRPKEAESSLRLAFKSLRMLGAPPASLVRFIESQGKRAEDSPICYQFWREYRDINFFRIDHSTTDNLANRIKSLLKSGIPSAFGMAIPSSIGVDSRIDLRSAYDTVVGYSAGVFVGFDDNYRISSDAYSRGAFCFQSVFSPNWGENGYGWLSYEMLRQGMITDVWTAMKPSWLQGMAQDRGMRFDDSCSFERPV